MFEKYNYNISAIVGCIYGPMSWKSIHWEPIFPCGQTDGQTW